jgi:hypothetical protein
MVTAIFANATKLVITALVAVHLAASLWHGNAHTRLAIYLPTVKTLFVFIVILIAPVVSAALVWTRHFSIGIWVLFPSMLGSFLFGAYHHYLLVSPDNIAHLPAGSPEMHSQFITSAGVIALLELAGALYGAYCLGAYRSQSRGLV